MYINQNKIHLWQNKYLRINSFLNDEFAERLSNCLQNKVDRGLACRIDGSSKTFSKTNDVQNLETKVANKLDQQMGVEFQFIYNTYMMITAYIEKRGSAYFLNRILEWLNGPEVINYFKRLTNDRPIKKINAQATRYMPGHFLTQHTDENYEEGRLYSNVMGFSKKWNPDWGGLLHILDGDNNIVKTLIPEYNTLSIFKVPKNHFVSLVSPFARNERLAITGWLLSK